MKIGVVFPQMEIGADPGAVRDFAQAAEDLGYSHIIFWDHVLGADTDFHRDWTGHTRKDMFHEPMVTFGYLAGLTKTIGFVTGVLVLGQRQTALVAKQAAEVDVLSGGRLRLGIGIGWNHVEYEALGSSFTNRGRRSEEQVELLRALWTQDTVSFDGRWHKVTHAGLNPLPVQRPIPVWFGGSSDAVMRRIARIGDGWFPQITMDAPGRETLSRLRTYIQEAGREPDAVGIEGRINFGDSSPEDWVLQAREWQEAGATHLSVKTMRAGLNSPDAHIDAIRQFKEAVSA